MLTKKYVLFFSSLLAFYVSIHADKIVGCLRISVGADVRARNGDHHRAAHEPLTVATRMRVHEKDEDVHVLPAGEQLADNRCRERAGRR